MKGKEGKGKKLKNDSTYSPVSKEPRIVVPIEFWTNLQKNKWIGIYGYNTKIQWNQEVVEL